MLSKSKAFEKHFDFILYIETKIVNRRANLVMNLLGRDMPQYQQNQYQPEYQPSLPTNPIHKSRYIHTNNSQGTHTEQIMTERLMTEQLMWLND